MSNRYEQGKIYKIINDNDPEKFYIGSTIYTLSKRMSLHSSASKILSKQRKLYTAMRENGIEQFKIILLENYSCNNKEELHLREQYYISQLKPFYNMKSAIVSDEERKQQKKHYLEENKEKIKQHKKQYREENKEKVNQHKKQYYEANKKKVIQHVKDYYNMHKDEVKNYQEQYRANNKEKIKQRDKEYRESHKEEKKIRDKEYRESHKKK